MKVMANKLQISLVLSKQFLCMCAFIDINLHNSEKLFFFHLRNIDITKDSFGYFDTEICSISRNSSVVMNVEYILRSKK